MILVRVRRLFSSLAYGRRVDPLQLAQKHSVRPPFQQQLQSAPLRTVDKSEVSYRSPRTGVLSGTFFMHAAMKGFVTLQSSSLPPR